MKNLLISTKFLVEWCLKNDINTIVLGYNEGWKAGINLGRKTNQNFVGIPYETLRWQINYKSYMMGLNFLAQEESYTSKCSSLDLEPVKKQQKYVGRRIKRGIFKTAKGKLINADVNGSLNILRKAIPNVNFIDGIEAAAVLPRRIKSFKV